MACKSHDPELHGDSSKLESYTEYMTPQESAVLLSKIAKKLSPRMSHEIIAMSLQPDTQQMVLSQLLPVYFAPHGLTTHVSVVISLLFHCFLMSKEFEEVKEHLGSREVAKIQEEVQMLKELYDGVVQVNQQWALDYEKLQKQIASAKVTGFTTETSHCHGSILMSPSSERCFGCYLNQGRVSEGVSDVECVKEECEELKRELQEAKLREEALKKERDRAVNENRAVQYQLAELGDLRAALTIKDDYPKRVQELRSVQRQYQEELCLRLKLEKQIERLRQVFTDLFPKFRTDQPRGHVTGHVTYPPHLRPYHAQQQLYSDPGPPTPPGLIARGQLTSLVERDMQSLSQQSSLSQHRDREEPVTGYEKPVILLDVARPQERWASDPHLNTEQVANRHSQVPRGRGSRSRRPRSLFVDRDDLVKSLCDVRSDREEFSNHISPPLEGQQGFGGKEAKCPICAQMFHQSDMLFDHVRHCGT